jgi:hypothetical protein
LDCRDEGLEAKVEEEIKRFMVIVFLFEHLEFVTNTKK